MDLKFKKKNVSCVQHYHKYKCKLGNFAPGIWILLNKTTVSNRRDRAIASFLSHVLNTIQRNLFHLVYFNSCSKLI